MEVEKIDPRTIGTVRGAGQNTYTAGVICAKVARYSERVHHPDRLQTPLVRSGPKGSGQFQSISWDEALGLVAQKFQQAVAKYGSETVWPYYMGGTMGVVQRYSIERLTNALSYSRMKEGLCVGIARTGWLAGVGSLWGADTREIGEAELIVIWGGNPVNTQVNVMTHASRARKKQRAKIVVIDPYRTGTSAAADVHLALRPGTDGALACAVMHVLFEENFADWDYLRKYTDAPDELRIHLKDKTPQWAAGITGVLADDIVAFARLYGSVKKSFLKCGYGFSRSRNGAINFHAVTCLPTITGAWLHRGGGASWHNGGIYHWNRNVLEGLDLKAPDVRIMEQARIGPVLNNAPEDIAGGPPVTAMLIQHVNPCAVAPDTNAVLAGFSRSDLFVCVHEQFLTDTAKMADVVLPATTFLEHDDVYQASGHTHIQIGARIIEPYAETRSNCDVINALAARLGVTHPSFAMSEWEHVDHLLTASGWPDAKSLHAKRWHDCAPAFDDAHFINGFGFPDGRFRFKPDWRSFGSKTDGLPTMPDHFNVTDPVSPDVPYRLITAPARTFLNTSFTETKGSRAREKRPTAMIHPGDAEELGIVGGDLIEVGNVRGKISVHAETNGGISSGTVIIESVWPNDAFPEGVGVNALTSADRAYPGGGAVFHDTAVWIRPARSFQLMPA